jgi:NitT/TauT family transport system substrate-binding protein
VLTNIQFALTAGAFTGGTGDYVALFEPVASQMELANQGYVVASLGLEAGEVPYTVFSASQSYIADHQEVIQKFTTALAKAQQWVQEASAQEVALAIKASFPDTDEALLISAINRYRDQGSWAKTPVFTESAFDRLQDIMTDAGQLDQRAPYKDLVTNLYAEQALKELGGK